MFIRARLAAALTAAVVVALTATAAITATLTSSAQSPDVPGSVAAVPPPAPAATTPTGAGSILVPIAPCRVVDTRAGGGKLAGGSTRNFAVSGTAGFPAQGGKSGGCGIPASATAVALSIVATREGTGGYLTAWPAGTARPTASILNFPKNQTTNTGATVSITSANPALSVYASGGPLDVVIDITGYYQQEIHARVTSAGVLDWATNRVISSSRLQPGVFLVTVDRSLSGCSATASAHGGSPLFTSTAITGSTAIVYLWSTSGSPVDAYFYLDVSC